MLAKKTPSPNLLFIGLLVLAVLALVAFYFWPRK
jgi:hypothetical protein